MSRVMDVLAQKDLYSVEPGQNVTDVARRMTELHVGAILVMENGAIVEQGSHAELLAAHGAYARLYQAQFTAPVADVA